ncbi:hypothetical protein CRG98_030527 [Punica granatum]|uniref:TIR domain-containing protein n=1 Tax=Punica granatum TaxID=22663 RepID=A0A2I0IYP2_PUNGR|nr:hypothetical protein CRG98_030527 [Punica granatum]
MASCPTYAALYWVGINAFIDEEGVRGGDVIASSILYGIKKSRISIAILSDPCEVASDTCEVTKAAMASLLKSRIHLGV